MVKNRLHILFLCSWYPSRVLPTNGDFIQRHAEAVSTRHKVSVLHLVSDHRLKQPVQIVREEINQVQTYIAYIKPDYLPIKGIRFFRAFRQLLATIEPFDIVHLNKLYPFGIFALYLKWFKSKQYIISEHWTGYQASNNVKIAPIERYLSRIITRQAAFVCPVSGNLRDAMKRHGLEGEYTIVPNVVDTHFFKPLIGKRKTDIFSIVHISNMLDVHKNVSGVLKAVAAFAEKVTPFRLILIGQGGSQYKPLAKKLGISDKIIFMEQIPHQEVITQLQRASVCVLFSWYENLPCVILESFACGTPVISSDVGGISEYFPDTFGYLVEAGNENALLEKLLELYQQPIDSGPEMHVYADQHFGVEAISSRFSNLYQKALS